MGAAVRYRRVGANRLVDEESAAVTLRFGARLRSISHSAGCRLRIDQSIQGLPREYLNYISCSIPVPLVYCIAELRLGIPIRITALYYEISRVKVNSRT
jgi:hypothetical protein